MDASSKTPIVPDGKGGTRGGRCLNDLTVKGRIDTLDLMNMILRFVLGPVGYSGDHGPANDPFFLTPNKAQTNILISHSQQYKSRPNLSPKNMPNQMSTNLFSSHSGTQTIGTQIFD